MNAFGRGGGSSSESSDSEDESDFLLYPDANPNGNDSVEHRRKRQKTGRDAKESAALGIFGSESDDERPGQRWKARSLRTKGVGFTKAGATSGNGEHASQSEEDSLDDDQDEPMKEPDIHETAGLRGLGARGLGHGDNYSDEAKVTSEEPNTFTTSTPLGKGWQPSSAKQPVLQFAPPVDEATTPTVIRPSFHTPTSRQNGNGKDRAPTGPTRANPNSFAAKMMAKMGYVEGQGLGSTGRGRLAPIETQLRPQGVGLGAVKEKTKQAKEEEKREAAFRGVTIENSSEEEKKRRKQQKEKRVSGITDGRGTPGRSAKPKLKFRTAAEIEAVADGLEVPNVLKSIIDATGKEPKLLTSATGLMTPKDSTVLSNTEATKIARRARRDLEAFADEWVGLMERKKFFEMQESQLMREIDEQREEIQRQQEIVNAIIQLREATLVEDEGSISMSSWEQTTQKLEALEHTYRDDIDSYELQEVAVAAIHPLFRAAMEDWEPLTNPTHTVSFLERTRNILGIKSEIGDSLTLQNGYHQAKPRAKSTSPYETLLYTLWLPPVRSAITNQWDVHDPTSLIILMEAWRPLLPSFILHNLIDQLIVRLLVTAISSWNPRPHRAPKQALPHSWLFPWLPHLSSYNTDPSSSNGLLKTFTRRLRHILSNWPLTSPDPPWLTPWLSVLGSELSSVFFRHLLPRLTAHLSLNFIVDPSDQNLTPLTTVLAWASLFKPSTFASLLATEFFPKWHATLHIWLTSEPNYDEIREWFLWWKDQIPASFNTLPPIDAEWTKGLETINLALELGSDAKSQLLPPAAGPSRPITETTRSAATSATSQRPTSIAPPVEQPTFKDVLSDWCTEQGLLLLPLREAHERTGLPLWRITASANGKGGAIVFVKGDVVWARNRKDKTKWEPVGLDEGLVERAETSHR
ncbi:hypothetical protein MMC20_007794 [Loxospora ochrophaea]|nr:hypothetical protein [Loxospora ochrophaea]